MKLVRCNQNRLKFSWSNAYYQRLCRPKGIASLLQPEESSAERRKTIFKSSRFIWLAAQCVFRTNNNHFKQIIKILGATLFIQIFIRCMNKQEKNSVKHKEYWFYVFFYSVSKIFPLSFSLLNQARLHQTKFPFCSWIVCMANSKWFRKTGNYTKFCAFNWIQRICAPINHQNWMNVVVMDRN